MAMDWGEDDVAAQLWVHASTKGGSQRLEFGDLDWIGAKADTAMQLLVRTSTQGGSQRQEVTWIGLVRKQTWRCSSWSALPHRVEVSALSLVAWIGLDWRRWSAALGPRFHKGRKSAPGAWMSGTRDFAYVCALFADGVTSLRTRGVFYHQIFYFHFKTGVDQLPD